jgi:hypothetical protein
VIGAGTYEREVGLCSVAGKPHAAFTHHSTEAIGLDQEMERTPGKVDNMTEPFPSFSPISQNQRSNKDRSMTEGK